MNKYRQNNLKKFFLATKIKEIYSKNLNDYLCPYIATRGFTHTFDTNDDVVFNFYITDWFQREYFLELYDLTFTIYIIIDGTTHIFNDEFAGDKTKVFGKLSEGEHTVIMQVEDKYGRKSHELYNEFRVINKSEKEIDIATYTYTMTTEDLETYGLDNTDDDSKADSNRIGLQNLFDTVASNGYKKIIMLEGIYRILCNSTKVWTSDVFYVEYTKDVLSIPSNFIIDMNGCTFKQMTSDGQSKAWMIVMNNVYDSHLTNGILQGDWGIRDETQWDDLCTGEHLGGGGIFGDSKYCSFNNLTFKNFLGHTVSTGIPVVGCKTGLNGSEISQVIVFNETGKLGNWSNIELDNEGNEIMSNYKWTSDYLDLSAIPNLLTKPIIRVAPWLGNQWYGCEGDDWIIPYYFYDENKKLIKKTVGHQYRDIKIPPNAKYLRATYSMQSTNNNISSLKDIFVAYPGFPRNVDFYNLTFEDIRPCAMAPYQGNAVKIDNCTFARCGQNITPLAIDFEDGWNNMQDYHISNCEILEPAGTGDLITKGGLDILCENLTNFRIGCGSTNRGFVCRNNPNIPCLRIQLSNHKVSAYFMCYNNISITPLTSDGYYNSGWVSIGDTGSGNYQFMIKDCTFINNNPYATYPKHYNLRNVIDWNYTPLKFRASILGGTYFDCTLKNFSVVSSSISNLIMYGGKLLNCEVESLKDNLELQNVIVNKLSFSNFNSEINIKFENCNVTDFKLNRYGVYDKYNVNIELINCTFSNNTFDKNIIGDDWNNKNFTNGAQFNIYIKDCTFLNNTVIANDIILNNPNFNIIIE